MKLTNHDRFQLIIEITATALILSLFDLVIITSIDVAVKNNPLIHLGITTLQSAFFSNKPIQPQSVKFPHGLYLHWWIVIPLILVNIGAMAWRIKRRYHLIQINHIIQELKYIANGHFNHKIPFRVKGKTQEIINNINKLVSSVISSMHKRKAMAQSKNELITNVSHDIRTPLTSILGYLGLIETHHCNRQRVYQYVHIAYFKAEQMKNLADELFEYTKISRNHVPMHYHRINIHQMLTQLAIGGQLRAQKVGMRIIVLDNNSQLTMVADAAKIGRALNDLISNALKYGHTGKHIYLSAQLSDDQHVKITVANDGQKIPRSSLKSIFSRFYRVEKSRNRQTGGSGLGLAIVANIIRLQHGTIQVRSTDQLTSFMLYLPLNNQISRKA